MSPKFVFLGHHKGATRYFSTIFNQLCKKLGLESREYDNAEKLLAAKDLKANDLFVHFTNANQLAFQEVFTNQNSIKGIHIIRDPRDTVVSAYFSHKYSHGDQKSERLRNHRAALLRLDTQEGLIKEIDYSADNMENLFSWAGYKNANILRIKYEDFIQAPYQTWLNIGNHLGILDSNAIEYSSLKDLIKLLSTELKLRLNFRTKHSDLIEPQFLLNLVYANRFEAKSKGRKPGDENISSHYRKGIAGDWQNYFDKKSTQYFKDKYNPILLEFGYETSEAW